MHELGLHIGFQFRGRCLSAGVQLLKKGDSAGAPPEFKHGSPVLARLAGFGRHLERVIIESASGTAFQAPY